MVQQNKIANNDAAVQTTPSEPSTPVPDPKSLGQYAFDKMFNAAGKGLDRIEQEKPGTCRKLAGIAAITIGISAGIGIIAGGISSGILLLST